MPKPTSKRGGRKTQQQVLLEKGVRSGLEDVITDYLKEQGVGFSYEAHKLPWVPPLKPHHYTPDWVLDNGIIIEGKGRLDTADRQKMIQIKKQHPDLDIRFVFSNSKTTLVTQQHTAFKAWAVKCGHAIPRSGPRRERLKGMFFDHLKSIGKRPPSQTTYGMWADQHGFPYANSLPPVEWLKEAPNAASLAALQEYKKK